MLWLTLFLRIKQNASLLCIKFSLENLVENSLSPPRHYLCQLFLQLLDFGLLLCIDLQLNRKMGRDEKKSGKTEIERRLSTYDTMFILIHFLKTFISPCKSQCHKMPQGKSTPILLSSGWFHIWSPSRLISMTEHYSELFLFFICCSLLMNKTFMYQSPNSQFR